MFDHVATPRINREINVTPMIDVLLVLLIIAIILNMTRHTIRVAAAEPPAQAATAPAPQLVLALPAAGGFELNGQPVPREALVEVLRGAISVSPERGTRLLAQVTPDPLAEGRGKD